MIVGLDLDNTIVCYDDIFHRESRRRQLIPESLLLPKEMIRDYLHSQGNPDLWAELQGYVYGPGMIYAQPFAGVMDFLCLCREKHIKTVIISHKTEFPYRGEQYSLHESARRWLNENGLFKTELTGLSDSDLFFLSDLRLKAEKVREVGCTHFIDDLPKFLADASLPVSLKRILFDPNNIHCDVAYAGVQRVSTWAAISQLIIGNEVRE
jgi:hypothetical protein